MLALWEVSHHGRDHVYSHAVRRSKPARWRCHLLKEMPDQTPAFQPPSPDTSPGDEVTLRCLQSQPLSNCTGGTLRKNCPPEPVNLQNCERQYYCFSYKLWVVVCNTKLGNCNECPAPPWMTVFQYGTIQSAVLSEVDKCLLRTYYVPASGLRVSDTLLKKKKKKPRRFFPLMELTFSQGRQTTNRR